jgi:hypothetical protein
MTVDRLIHIFAGSFILLSLALGVQGSPLFVSQLVAGLHGLRRRQPAAVRLHQGLPAGLILRRSWACPKATSAAPALSAQTAS